MHAFIMYSQLINTTVS